MSSRDNESTVIKLLASGLALLGSVIWVRVVQNGCWRPAIHSSFSTEVR
jgi:hypothetical protein